MKTLFTFILSLTIVVAFSQQRTVNNKIYPPNGPGDAGTISVTGLGSSGLTPTDLVTKLVGSGITFSNVTFTGIQGGTATASAGEFSNGGVIGISDGIILSCGLINNAPGPNTAINISADLGLGGDADLNAAFGGITTYDATVLEFDFIPTGDSMYVQYVFGSDEYNEWVGSFNDAFAFFLDGTNIALVPGTATPVGVGTVNLLSNTVYYHNNDTPPYPFDLEADGFTTALSARAAVTPNVTHHIKLAIADNNDHNLDSWVFMKAASFSTLPPECIPTLSQWGLIILALLFLAAEMVYIRRRQYSFAMAGGADVTESRKSLFNSRSYFTILAVLLGISMLVFAVELILSISIPARDIAGAVVSSAILAYILHLVNAFRKK
jgi:hypothetical protein